MTILVTGVRGQVGSAVLRALIDAGQEVRAASRRPGDAAPVEGARTVRFDQSDPQTLPDALAGVHKVFLYAEPEGIEEFTAAARKAGVEHVVLLSSLSADSGHDDSPIARAHLTVERALDASGIDRTFVRPGGFSSNALQWAGPIRAARRLRLAYPQAHSEPIHERDMAEVSVRALLDDAHRGATFSITGPESLSQQRQVELISDALGEPVEVERISAQEYRAELLNHLPAPIADTVISYQAGQDGTPQPTRDDVRVVLGRPATGFAQWAADHAADFR
ncbi:SDR family oxidoreductase [Streptomyces sp. NPDC058221]|uniref:SDR family oxidoreductase n=1 Tax=Streptomyces sp. NPDC058221 TaxID=3346388 RepID=UPI0036ECD9A8